MSFLRYAHAVVALLFSIAVMAQPSANPLLVHSNSPVDFAAINAMLIKQAADITIQQSGERVKKIVGIPAKSRTTANTLVAYDELGYNIGELSMKLGFISSTYTDQSSRDAANTQGEKLSNYANTLSLNEGLYKAIKQYAATSAAQKLPPNRKKFLKESIVLFEKNGMKLDVAGRKQLEALNEKLTSFGIQFDKNIAESKDSVTCTAEQLTGVPDATRNPWKRGGDTYIVYINGPNYNEVVNNADNPDTRHIFFVRYNNRAYPKNITTLDSLFYYRNEYAKKLGFRSYAAYALVDKMAASPQNVWNFENDLAGKLTPHVTRELDELRNLKKP